MQEDFIKEETSITVRGSRHRTTIPRTIFKLLGLKDKDVLVWTAYKDGTITVSKVPSKQD